MQVIFSLTRCGLLRCILRSKNQFKILKSDVWFQRYTVVYEHGSCRKRTCVQVQFVMFFFITAMAKFNAQPMAIEGALGLYDEHPLPTGCLQTALRGASMIFMNGNQ